MPGFNILASVDVGSVFQLGKLYLAQFIELWWWWYKDVGKSCKPQQVLPMVWLKFEPDTSDYIYRALSTQAKHEYP